MIYLSNDFPFAPGQWSLKELQQLGVTITMVMEWRAELLVFPLTGVNHSGCRLSWHNHSPLCAAHVPRGRPSGSPPIPLPPRSPPCANPTNCLLPHLIQESRRLRQDKGVQRDGRVHSKLGLRLPQDEGPEIKVTFKL